VNRFGLSEVLQTRVWSLSYILGGSRTMGKRHILRYLSLGKHGGRANPAKLCIMGCGNTDSGFSWIMGVF